MGKESAAISDLRVAIKSCDDIDQLKKIRDEWRDVLIEMMPSIVNSQKSIRKKDRLKKRYVELVSEKFEALT